MKLLMVSGDRSILQGKKGAFWYTLEELSKHWERIDVICPYAGVSSFKFQVSSSNVFFHPSPRGLWYQPWWIVKKGTELVRDHHHDVMTVHEYPPFYNGIGAARLSKATGVPYALEIHHIVGFPAPASFSERIGMILSRVFLPFDAKRAAKVRTVNASVKDQLVRWGIPAGKIEVVPSFYLDGAALHPLGEVPTHDIVFCGRLVANKGLGNVIEALSSLDDATLLVVGDGPERARYEKQVRDADLESRVTFLGWMPDQLSTVRAMQRGKIFVMNSKSEGGPRVALEAMACGLPVITTNVGVMPEVIRDGVNGMFTTGAADDLAEKIAVLLGDGAMRERMGTEARKIMSQFERSALITGYADFLKTLV